MEYTQEELDKLKNEPFVFTDDKEEEAEVVEPIKEQVSVSPEEDAVPDKGRVPYSRFESVNERAIRAEERLKLLEEQAQSKTVETNNDIEVPSEWIELYGDEPAAIRAYQLQVSLNERMQEEATAKVLDKIKGQEREQQESIKRNLEEIDNSLSEFQESLGRKLSESEESTLLDIQDEFTPKDREGNYLAPLISPDKAFEILELRQQQANSQKLQAKKRVVSLTGANLESNVSGSSDTFRPGVTGQWRSKL